MGPQSVLYSRSLPGGGYVAIDCVVLPSGHSARLWVERRADPVRRSGHVPPVIAQAQGDDAERAVASLQEIAADNVALAQAIRRWQSRSAPQ
jgi:hypothetical protein